MKGLTGRVCLFYMHIWQSSSLSLLRECGVIVLQHNSVFSFLVGLWDTHSHSGLLVHGTTTMRRCRASLTTVAQSPGVWLFYDGSGCQIWSPHSIASLFISSMWTSVWGWAVAPWIQSVRIPSMAFIRTLNANPIPPSTAAPPSFNHCFAIEWNLFFSHMKHEIQAFILALAGISSCDQIQAALITSSTWCNVALLLPCTSVACFST